MLRHAALKDKLRAIEYFNCAVEAGSFAGAAELLHVSPPAVTQLISSLERSLGGIALFYRRGGQGVSLTEAGARYHQTSSRIAADLRDMERRMRPSMARPRGTITVGMRPSIAERCIMPRLHRFLERFPDVEVVGKLIASPRDVTEENTDLVVLMGWPHKRDLVVRYFLQTRQVICASPDYLKRAGTPRDPEDLRVHRCIVLRTITGVLLDRWLFARGDERRTVNVNSCLFSDDGTWEAAACGGAGVVRLADVAAAHDLSSGALVPVLTDWEALESPTIFAAHWRSNRRNKLIQLFLDFLVEVFAEIDRERPQTRPPAVSAVPVPDWFGRAHSRTSEFVAGGRASLKMR